MKYLLIAAAAITTLAVTSANAQSWGRGGAYTGAAPELNAYYRRGSGTHWCNWSVASTCSRWRANGNKSYGLGCTGPNDMRSGCVAERAGLR